MSFAGKKTSTIHSEEDVKAINLSEKINTEQLIKDIGSIIVEATDLKDIDLSLINAQTPLNSGILSLDSVDTLDAMVAIERYFNIKVENVEERRIYFQTVGSIADFIIYKHKKDL